ncbi:hypothetical protein CTAYLR_008854 [Chrysophaeum taylorii]|uniref:DUF819 protein n=1 Tax=Chrysophaeum taylorii TaxID=2483200 RepID=A0AAD7UNI5_9STRA|nr:hypothetical protein CTAYLR_008854 [Chrysophaeum taylorii]
MLLQVVASAVAWQQVPQPPKRVSVVRRVMSTEATWATLGTCAAGGLWAERYTKVGAAVSSNVVTMVATLALVNLGILPAKSPVYSLVTAKLVPLAIPLLLMDADLARVRRDGRKLLLPFVVASAGTVVGTLVAWPLAPLKSAIPDVEVRATIAAALAARHVGGAVNYVAVADAGAAPASIVAAGIAADNAVVAPYFALLFATTKAGEKDAGEAVGNKTTDVATAVDASAALAVGLACVAVASLAPRPFLLPLCTLYAVAIASAAPGFCRRVAPSGRVLGTCAMQLFVAAIGAAGDLRAVAAAGRALFVFSLLQIGVHYAIILAARRVFPRTLELRALAASSNAAVGGPTTAAAMCVAKRWDDLVLPALLVGILGYASGTFIALALQQALLWWN